MVLVLSGWKANKYIHTYERQKYKHQHKHEITQIFYGIIFDYLRFGRSSHNAKAIVMCTNDWRIIELDQKSSFGSALQTIRAEKQKHRTEQI